MTTQFVYSRKKQTGLLEAWRNTIATTFMSILGWLFWDILPLSKKNLRMELVEHRTVCVWF